MHQTQKDPGSRSTRLGIGVVVALIVLALIAGWLAQAMRPRSWSQEITAEITVDGQRYAGSSIAHIRWKKRWVLDLAGGFFGRRYQNRVDAEAVVIDVPNRTPVFVLLQYVFVDAQRQRRLVAENNRPYLSLDLAVATCLPKLGAYKIRTETEEVAAVMGCKGSVTPIPDAIRPLVVVFDDRADPSTPRAVTSDRELSEALGAESRLGPMTLKIGNEAPTRGNVRRYLPWLPETTVDWDGRNAKLAAAKTALARARGDVARQIVPQHFLLNTCYGAATSCADE